MEPIEEEWTQIKEYFFKKLLMLLLLLSCFSHVQLCETPQMAAHQAPLSLGFSRQEHWSELPFPSPMHESEKWKVKVKSLSRVQLFATPWTAAYQAPPSMGFSRQEYWSGVPLPSPILVLRMRKLRLWEGKRVAQKSQSTSWGSNSALPDFKYHTLFFSPISGSQRMAHKHLGVPWGLQGNNYVHVTVV